MFICEGLPIDNQWVETNFTSISNQPVFRQACNFTTAFDANNIESYIYNFKGPSSIVTMPCKRQATLSPVKDCGFTLVYDNLKCVSGEKTEIKVKNKDSTHAVVRLCETSHVLGHSIACEYVQMLANVELEAGGTKMVSFECPKKRSCEEPGGLYSMLVASLIPNESTLTVQYSAAIKNSVSTFLGYFLVIILISLF